ncbi:MAG: DUF3151 family protein [Acidimicrobiia bacterium]|nr:DUF3151 family protein [Acidimicrobiia bacterium]
MTEHLGLSPKPPETQIPLPFEQLYNSLKTSISSKDIELAAKLTSENPREIYCWAALSLLTIDSTKLETDHDKICAYSYARTGYHRGLDTLRANGWRGSGYVKSSYPGNRGFLSCLSLLAYMSGIIDEKDEESRCKEFLSMLDPLLSSNEFNVQYAIEFLLNKN